MFEMYKAHAKNINVFKIPQNLSAIRIYNSSAIVEIIVFCADWTAVVTSTLPQPLGTWESKD